MNGSWEGVIHFEEELIVALAIISLVMSAFWYTSTLSYTKETGLEGIEDIRAVCADLEKMSSQCVEEQHAYKLALDVACGGEMSKTLGDIEAEINSGKNYFTLRKFVTRPRNYYEILKGRQESLGDIYIGTKYFAELQETKLEKLFDKGALKKPCGSNLDLLKESAECDLANAKTVVPAEGSSLAARYLKQSEGALAKGDYMKSSIFSIAAAAYHDNNARKLYKDYTELGVCLKR